MNVLIVGAGVSGLTTAIALQQQGDQVKIVANKFLSKTTSTIAGALWEMPPAVCGFYEAPSPEVLKQERMWARETYHTLRNVSGHPDAGVTFRRVNFYLEQSLDDIPGEKEKYDALSRYVDGLDHQTSKAILVNDSYVDTYSYIAPQVDMDVYIPFLAQVFLNNGGSLISQDVHSMEELYQQPAPDLIVNCAGLGSGKLVPDDNVLPVRGAWFSVLNDGTHFPRIDEAHCTSLSKADGSFVFILPRGERRLIIGGIAQAERWDLNLSKDSPEIQVMLKNCFASFPQLKNADFENADFRVGLRPFRRGGVRLNLDLQSYPVPVISNYGHGGAGVLLSWGCADSVTALASDVRRQMSQQTYANLQLSRPSAVC